MIFDMNKTIADLEINYTFTDYYNGNEIEEKIFRFKKDNQKLFDIKIKSGEYDFLVDDTYFIINACSFNNIALFIEFINFKLWINSIKLPRKLIKFELISENTFRIHLEN